ncbi:hypothetical protein HS1_002415 [Candidatus Desulfofervidus auxilii]|uniref:Dockerin domain-containing protein n=1 Tax=Desulfofervidus auxilii TaxID=1621989 RepID=A0A7U4QMQ4_DESA2|nr:SBBP repeat-containing protein [Candidatus Desulfofervidus auxilii]AMM42197.1 hypothetical protein HS1_002415 [Candidatus Desulfofervidus auxilii]
MKSIIWLGEKLAMLVKRYKKATITAFILLFIFNYSAIGSVVKEKDKKEILNKAYTLKIPFIENKGQIKGESVKYYAKTFGGAVFVTKDGKLVYSLPKFEKKEKVKGWVIKESLVGASISNVKGKEEAVTKVSYFKGKDPSNWKRDISTYNLVSLGEVYKRIELKVKAYGKNVEKLFYVKAGANPESIKIKIEGAKSLRVNENGELEVETGLGVIKFTKPVAYQEINGKRVEVAAAYTLLSNPQYVYGFKVGSYDKKETLIIDPLLASTFIGGSDDDCFYYGLSIALDGGGNVYITGSTRSSDYPTTSGAYDESYNGGDYDVFVSKLDSSLSSLLASTFIGGSYSDYVYSIAIDGDGNVYVTGGASPGYPTTPGAYDESYNGSLDVFVSKLDSSLSNLLASTFIGGIFNDYGYSIALDGGGNVYITGGTQSSNYPTTSGAYDESHNGYDDVFVSKLDSSLSSLLASTFIGGIIGDYGYSIALDGGGNVYVTGYTSSSDYPTTSGAYDRSHNGRGYYDVFVSKLDSSLSNLLASTFIGGIYHDCGHSIALDGGGNVYITGGTSSSNYPTTPGAYDESHNNGDVFVSKLDSSLSNLLASTFIGGSSSDYGYSIALDGGGNVYVTGWTNSPDYPTTPGAYNESYNDTDYDNDYYDVFVSKLDSSLSNLLASTFIGGGSNSDYGYSIALDGGGNVYITGRTRSPDYPTTPGAYDESYNGGLDVFVSKLDSNLTSFPYSLKTVGWETVGSDGGTVLVTDTSSEILGAQVEIPADALSENTIIAISELVEEIPPFPEDIIGIGLPVHFGPEGLVFNKPVTIKLPYTEEDLENAGVSDPQELDVYTFNTTTLTWELVEGPKTVDEENMLIMIDVTHFSIFQLGVRKVTVQGDLDGDGDVDLDDLNILLTYRNQPASACPKCDIDGDGVITVLDARKLVLLCTRPRCACE